MSNIPFSRQRLYGLLDCHNLSQFNFEYTHQVHTLAKEEREREVETHNQRSLKLVFIVRLRLLCDNQLSTNSTQCTKFHCRDFFRFIIFEGKDFQGLYLDFLVMFHLQISAFFTHKYLVRYPKCGNSSMAPFELTVQCPQNFISFKTANLVLAE